MKIAGETELTMAGQRAAGYFGNGFHCAEAVAAAALELFGEDPSQATAHATAFGGGFGRTHQEACGALSGALIVIGHLFGRRRLGGDWDVAARLGAEIRKCFLDQFGTSHCETLRNRFGPESPMDECRNLTQKTTTLLLTIVNEHLSHPDGGDAEDAIALSRDKGK